MERNRQKAVGRDKASLTEQQRKRTVTTTIQIRRKLNTNCTTSTTAAPLLSRTAHDMEYPALFGQVGSARRLYPFLDSSEN